MIRLLIPVFIVLIIAAAYVYTQTVPVRRKRIKQLEAENRQLRLALDSVNGLALDSRSYEPILADLVIDRLNKLNQLQNGIR